MGRTARATNCQNDEKNIQDCREKNPVGTKAFVECKPGYELQRNQDVISKELFCLNDGRWDQKLIDCVPVCGKSTPKAQTFILGGTETNVTEVSLLLVQTNLKYF